MEKSEVYRRHEPNTKYSESAERTERKKFYQGKYWRALRARELKKAQANDLADVTRIYNQNKDIPFTDLQVFSSQDPIRPYCRECIKENRIQPAFVLDHIKAIKDGGAPLDSSNLQWLCNFHHQSKSSKERFNREG